MRLPWRQILTKLIYSFPLHLLLVQLRKRQLIMLIWVFLFSLILFDAGRIIGAPFLMLDPEYMYQVDHASLFIMGCATGLFVMAFHITGYILDGQYFRFLASLPLAFLRFCLNNSLVPLVFVAVYLYRFARFQMKNGLEQPLDVAIEVISFLAGLVLVHVLILSYFRLVNMDYLRLRDSKLGQKLEQNRIYRKANIRHYRENRRLKSYIAYHLDFDFRFKKISPYHLLDAKISQEVFNQNHLNAILLELGIITLIFVLGYFRDVPLMEIPAAASVILFFAIALMLSGALTFWLRGWVATFVVLLLLGLNFFLTQKYLKSDYSVFGIQYEAEQAEYTLGALRQLTSQRHQKRDLAHGRQILDNWRSHYPRGTKPKLVLIAASGGGQRAAMWTYRSLQAIDRRLETPLMAQSTLITGASGGMIGAAFYRELFLRSQTNSAIDPTDNRYRRKIGKDMLNPLIFTLVVNDLFFRFQTFQTQDSLVYLRDRGLSFEKQLNRNTNHVLDKSLLDYYEPEYRARIPQLLLTATIVNDGRKLYISPQPMSYMCTATTPAIKKISGAEFTRLFWEQRAFNLHFTSALRMNATFPYITPNITLPSKPVMEVMDGGLLDNYGVKDAIKYLFAHRQWLEKNTSGVVLVTIRDSGKEPLTLPRGPHSIFRRFYNPIGSLYDNWTYLQDNRNQASLSKVGGWLDVPFHQVAFQYVQDNSAPKEKGPDDIQFRPEDRASLSWHLTAKEKRNIVRTMERPVNQRALAKLQGLLKSQQIPGFSGPSTPADTLFAPATGSPKAKRPHQKASVAE